MRRESQAWPTSCSASRGREEWVDSNGLLPIYSPSPQILFPQRRDPSTPIGSSEEDTPRPEIVLSELRAPPGVSSAVFPS